MSDRQVIKQAATEIGQELGRLQGKLFVLEAQAAAVKQQIQRLDAVFQNLKGELSGKSAVQAPTLIDPNEAIEALRDELPRLDPASQGTCLDALRILLEDTSYTSVQARNQAAINRLRQHPWKQGEAIALAQKVERSLLV